MVEKVTMPQLGESVTEGTITTWLKKPGEQVNMYEPLCEVTTDKVNAEIPATVAGKLTHIVTDEGATVAVGDVICKIDSDSEQIETQSVVSSETEQKLNQDSAQAASAYQSGTDMRKRYSPAVLKLSQDHGVDLDSIKGTGRGGRITRKDVIAYIEQSTTHEQPEKVSKVEGPPTPYTADREDREVELTPVRRAISERMAVSKREIPHAWLMVETDVTKLVKFRQRMKRSFAQKEGFSLTYFPFFIKAVVESLKEFPRLNSTWAGDKIIEKNAINVSIAVAAEDTLYVPVIRDADQLSIYGLAKAVNHLVQKTRSGQLKPEDSQGGTFTVNNTGTIGSVVSAPIINYPQAAIITIESIVKRPVVINEAIAIRDMVNICMSLDHRILDGLMAGKFIQSVKQRLECYDDDTQLY